MAYPHKTPDKSGHPTPRRGRPIKNTMPEPIPDTPENVARAIMQGPPKKKWDYLKAVAKKPIG